VNKLNLKKVYPEFRKLKDEHKVTTYEVFSYLKCKEGYSNIVDEVHEEYPTIPKEELLTIAFETPIERPRYAPLSVNSTVSPNNITPFDTHFSAIKKSIINYARLSADLEPHISLKKAKSVYKEVFFDQKIMDAINNTADKSGTPARFLLWRFLKHSVSPETLMQEGVREYINRFHETDEIEHLCNSPMSDLKNLKDEYFTFKTSIDNRTEKFLRYKREQVLHKWEYQRDLLEHLLQAKPNLNYETIVNDSKRRIAKTQDNLLKGKAFLPQTLINHNKSTIEIHTYFIHALIEEENWVRRRLREIAEGYVDERPPGVKD